MSGVGDDGKSLADMSIGVNIVKQERDKIEDLLKFGKNLLSKGL